MRWFVFLLGLSRFGGCGPDPAIDYDGPTSGWAQAGGALGGGHYAAATQITPILFQDNLYYCTPYNRIFAVDAETGEERWVFDPQVDLDKYAVPRCRGVSSWTSARIPEGEACHHQIVAPVLDARLVAVDALTGQRCPDFGSNGEVNLREGLGTHDVTEYLLTTPPAIVGDLAVTGGAVTDNISTTVPSGVVRAYDLNTGALAWYWDPIPPGQAPILDLAGGPEEDQRYQRATTNVWSFISADPDLGLVCVPTGNTSPDYYGGHRNGSDYYSSSVVALSLETGEVVWRFQTVHHDIWDYDVPSQPTLYDIEMDGRVVRALAQTTKMGYVFLLDRETGEPLFPVEERPVPQGAAPGDFTAPTQPFPSRPPTLVDTNFTADDVWGVTPWDRGACQERMENIRTEGLFTPPSVEGSIHFPSAVGGQNWGGPALDYRENILVVNTLHMASIVQLVPRDQCDAAAVARAADPLASKFATIEPSAGTPYCDLRWVGFFSPLEVPCTPPPWGTLAGIDLASGELLWQVPLGTTRDLAPFPFWFIEGVPNMDGPATTASGLTFIAATTDFFLRAFDTGTGEELWRGRLPTGGHATPMTYRLGPDSKQYVVIAAGGHYSFGTPASDHIIAFALPD